jgi:hypothetical protein
MKELRAGNPNLTLKYKFESDYNYKIETFVKNTYKAKCKDRECFYLDKNDISKIVEHCRVLDTYYKNEQLNII